jgi:hypothetical protein
VRNVAKGVAGCPWAGCLRFGLTTPAKTSRPEYPRLSGERNGSRSGERHAEAGEPDEILRLLQLHPRIPKELYVQLMEQAEQTTGSLRERQDLKYELRASFWRTLQEEAAKMVTAPPQGTNGEA